MYLGQVRNQRRGRVVRMRRGLGTTSAAVGNTLVYGSSPVLAPTPSTIFRVAPPVRVASPVIVPVRITGPLRPVVGPVEIVHPMMPIPPYNSIAIGYAPPSPTANNPSTLAVAQALYNSNPGLLTQAQWTLLQNAGIVPGTLPYSSASQVGPGGSQLPAPTGPTTPDTSTNPSDTGSPFSTVYAGLPLWAWLAIGGGGFYLFTRKGR